MVALQHICSCWKPRADSEIPGGDTVSGLSRAVFFLLGLALWDKALAIWSLAGLALAAALYPGTHDRRWRCRRAGWLWLSRHSSLGALPLIVYNVRMSAATIDQTVAYDIGHIPQKLHALKTTADGSGLFGWLTAEDGQTRRNVPGHPAPHYLSAAIASFTGSPRRNGMLYAFCAALLLTPLSTKPERRAIAFALLAMAGAWALMAITANAGRQPASHNPPLPLPQLVMGVSFAAASRRLGRGGRPTLAVVLILLVGSNLAVLNTYYTTMVRNGGAINWTDAIFALSRSVNALPARELYCVDWGIMGSLHLLNQGRLPSGGGIG